MMAEEYTTSHDLSLDARKERGRIWIDGCFDFVHHGHAGAMLQARQVGTELYVGVHSDEEIALNKGPPVMELCERLAAVDACRWATRSIPHAPYVTQLDYIDKYGTKYVAHGDDITTDANGHDTYRFVKSAGRMLVVRRTPGISTTDLVGRMLAEPGKVDSVLGKENPACQHHVRSVAAVLSGDETCTSGSGPELKTRITSYATDVTGLEPGLPVWNYNNGDWTSLVKGQQPRPGQRVVYVDGGWDLFCSGHIAFLWAVIATEEKRAHETGWFEAAARQQRVNETGRDYSPTYVIVGVYSDAAVHAAKGKNYPIMSIFERGLCALQCRHVSALIFSAPPPTQDFLISFPIANATTNSQSQQEQIRTPDMVYHGPVTTKDIVAPGVPRAYADAHALGIFTTIDDHEYQDVHAETIVERILTNRAKFEERQRIKGVKAVGEFELRDEELKIRE